MIFLIAVFIVAALISAFGDNWENVKFFIVCAGICTTVFALNMLGKE